MGWMDQSKIDASPTIVSHFHDEALCGQNTS